ncbi:MAG: YARHG domain-containing protein [Flavobacterium sp.]|nr:MAG: YARHG domain-containing protein [Flavobacterium sp.]
MKKLVAPLAIIAILLACNTDTKKTNTDLDTMATVASENATHADLYGMWVGDFEPVDIKEGAPDVQTNKITLVIKSISTNNDVLGQSIVAGNNRPLKGKLNELNGNLSFVLDEPGDDKYDGRFEFEFKDNALVGVWKSYKNTLYVTKRSFILNKKSFVYNANLMLSENGDYTDYYGKKTKAVTDTVDGVATEVYMEEFYRTASNAVYELNASTDNLTEATLKKLSKLDLQIIRNTIFARHGYTFKKKNYRQFFNPVEWYVPISNNIDGQLTAIEKKNIALLQKFEKYAEDNYDTFGR